MTPLEKKRIQSAIAGRVIDSQTLLPIADARVALAGPPAFQSILSTLAVRWGAAWAELATRPDRAITREDGFFQFGDVPNGSYTLTVTFPGIGERYGTSTVMTTVTHAANGTAPLNIVSITMPPTAVKGKIMRSFPPSSPAKPPAVLPMALVLVRGTCQQAYTNANGDYYLTGVDPGQHTLRIMAPGLVDGSATVTITAGVVTQLATVTLNP